MSNKALIKKYFNFLKRYGFKRKIYERGADYEIEYIKGKVSILVCRGLSTLDSDIFSRKEIDTDEMLKSSF